MSNRQRTNIFRASTSDEQAKVIAHRIKAIDYELMAIVTGGARARRDPFNARTADRLAHIQRQLRALRIEMEVERRFDTVPMRIPHGPQSTHPHLHSNL